MSNIEQNLQKILSSRYGKDVRQSIHDSIHDCYEDGKSGAVDLVARERIDNLVANNNPTDGNSELVDIRIGADGETYESAGEAVREQISSLSEDIDEKIITGKNLIRQIVKGYLHSTTNGELSQNEYTKGYATTNLIKVSPGNYVSNKNIRSYCLYDDKKSFLSSVSTNTPIGTIIKISEGVRYIALNTIDANNILEIIDFKWQFESGEIITEYENFTYKFSSDKAYEVALEIQKELEDNNFDYNASLVNDFFTDVPTKDYNLSENESLLTFKKSEFSGWVARIDGKYNFKTNGVTIKLSSREDPFTKVRIRLFCDGQEGFSRIYDVDFKPNENKEVYFSFKKNLEINAVENFYIGYQCDNFCNLWCKKSNISNLGYWTNGNMEDNFQTSFEAHKNYVIDATLKITELKTILPEIERRISTLEENLGIDKTSAQIILPQKFNLIVGDTFELFYKGISKCVNSNFYDYEFTIDESQNLGKSYKRKYVFTPEEKDIGEHNVTIKMIDNAGNIIDEKSTIFNVNEIPTSPPEEEVHLSIGDSLSEGGQWIKEFNRRLTSNDGTPVGYELNNIRFIGTCEKDGVNYEGYGGWSFSTYLSESKIDRFMNVFGTFDKTEADQHSVYKDTNNTQWKLETIESDKIKIIRVSSRGVLPESGTLTWVSGGENHNDIVYSSSEMVPGNPFWDSETQSVDFEKYAQKFGVGKIDRVNILLGWNSTEKQEDEYKELCRTFLRKILSVFPSCKITLMGLEIPSRDGFGENYGISWKYFEKMSFVFDLEKWYQDICEEDEFKTKVNYTNVSAQFDTEFNMSTAIRNANVRSTQKETIQINGVHPANDGYMQIADVATRNYAGI